MDWQMGAAILNKAAYHAKNEIFISFLIKKIVLFQKCDIIRSGKGICQIMTNIQKERGYLEIFMAGCLWGSIGIFVNLLSGLGINSGTDAFIRIFSGAVLLIPVMMLRGGLQLMRIDRKGLLICTILGVFSQALFNFSYNMSINDVGMATASVLLYTSPIFVCMMSAVFFREHIGAAKAAALAVNIAGCVLTVTGGNFSELTFSVAGVAAGVGAGFFLRIDDHYQYADNGKIRSSYHTVLQFSVWVCRTGGHGPAMGNHRRHLWSASGICSICSIWSDTYGRGIYALHEGTFKKTCNFKGACHRIGRNGRGCPYRDTGIY